MVHLLLKWTKCLELRKFISRAEFPSKETCVFDSSSHSSICSSDISILCINNSTDMQSVFFCLVGLKALWYIKTNPTDLVYTTECSEFVSQISDSVQLRKRKLTVSFDSLKTGSNVIHFFHLTDTTSDRFINKYLHHEIEVSRIVAFVLQNVIRF